jgi:AcrR family transcriptional regulator
MIGATWKRPQAMKAATVARKTLPVISPASPRTRWNTIAEAISASTPAAATQVSHGNTPAATSRRLYETGTSGPRTILDAHIHPGDIAPVLTQLAGAVLVRVAYEGGPASEGFVDDLIRRVLQSARPATTGTATGGQGT